MAEDRIERVMSAITIDQLRGETLQTDWVAQVIVGALQRGESRAQSYMAHGKTPAEALRALKTEVQKAEEGWSW